MVQKDSKAPAHKAEKPKDEPVDVNSSVKDERTGAKGFVSEAQLSTEQVVQRRTSTVDGGPEWPADGRYRKVFTVQVPRVSSGTVDDLDWSDSQHDAMHEANKVAVLQEALNRGLHPQEEAQFDGPLGDSSDDASGTDTLVYSVKAIPAASEGDVAAKAYTPSAALADQGGSTLPEFNGQDERK